ncbi:hypothetical protein AGDE_05155 [Angomonas deanei]|nr:hypothetical protein AGDE_05155 [Angomonas deanei]|eukprot:EPY38774.1 hypothetical protein AGDE_05155 [Angomonas deanei]
MFRYAVFVSCICCDPPGITLAMNIPCDFLSYHFSIFRTLIFKYPLLSNQLQSIMGEVDYWSATRKAYEPLQLEQPEFTDKHLKRPPFKFIFDIVTNINKRFAAYDHIFTLDLLDYDSIDSKEKKIDYLKRLIKYVEKLLKVKIDVSAKKIVAGQECEKTNIFLQYVAMAVGLAQQDKQKRVSVSAPPQPPAVEPAGAANSGTNNLSSAGESNTAFANPADYGFADLPARHSLPRKKSSSGGESATGFAAREERKNNLLKEVADFNRTLAGYHLNVDVEEPADVRAMGQSIVTMWNQMHEVNTQTTPSNMPVEALETAIKRQIENIQQIQGIIEKNEELLSHLEDVLV